MLMPQVDKSSYIAPLSSFLLLPSQFFLHFFPPSTLTWEENRSNGLIYFSICIENKGQPWMVLWSRLGKKGRQKGNGKERERERERRNERLRKTERFSSPPSSLSLILPICYPSLSSFSSFFLILNITGPVHRKKKHPILRKKRKDGKRCEVGWRVKREKPSSHLTFSPRFNLHVEEKLST